MSVTRRSTRPSIRAGIAGQRSGAASYAVGGGLDGAITDGFQTLEVWESKEHYDRANTDIVFPLM
jgi:hypothetical protein